jgi:hypothetical protein
VRKNVDVRDGNGRVDRKKDWTWGRNGRVDRDVLAMRDSAVILRVCFDVDGRQVFWMTDKRVKIETR